MIDCNHPPSCLHPNIPGIFFASLSKILVITFKLCLTEPPPRCLGGSQDVNESSVTSNPCYIQVLSASPTYFGQNLYNEDLLHFFRNFLIFWCNSSKSGKVFVLQKKIIRIMDGAPTRTSCRSLFRHLEILLVLFIYIYIYIYLIKQIHSQ